MSRVLILASGSPRRKEMLLQLGLEYEVMPMDIDESLRADEPAEDYVLRLALEKARSAWTVRSSANHVVLAADTTVLLGEQILGKPGDQQEAVSMLKALSGSVHEVLTGVSVVSAGREDTLCVKTSVTFRELGSAEIEYYWQTGEPADKAGSYGLQGAGAAFVDRIEGSYSNVIGLPLAETVSLLRAHGVSVLGVEAMEKQLLIQGGRNG